MNYEQRFGIDWIELDQEQALIRAFALGVAESYDNEPDGELDRVREEAESRYYRHLIETAYREGQGFGAEYRAADGDIDRGLPEFLQEIGFEVEDIVNTGKPLNDRHGVPSALESNPVQQGAPLHRQDIGLPKLLYRFKDRR